MRSSFHAAGVRTLLVVGLLAWTAALAGFDEGLAAYKSADYAAALAEFRPLADGGHAQAQFYLGFMYEKGQGVAADAASAVEWYRKAGDQGIAGAQFNVGLAFEQGRGVKVDPAAALIWITRAAERGHLRAQYKAAEMHEAGVGTARDLVQAHLWFSLAGRKRYEDARKRRQRVAGQMTPYEIAEAEMLARQWRQARKQT